MTKSAKFSRDVDISDRFLCYEKNTPKNDINLPGYTL